MPFLVDRAVDIAPNTACNDLVPGAESYGIDASSALTPVEGVEVKSKNKIEGCSFIPAFAGNKLPYKQKGNVLPQGFDLSQYNLIAIHDSPNHVSIVPIQNSPLIQVTNSFENLSQDPNIGRMSKSEKIPAFVTTKEGKEISLSSKEKFKVDFKVRAYTTLPWPIVRLGNSLSPRSDPTLVKCGDSILIGRAIYNDNKDLSSTKTVENYVPITGNFYPNLDSRIVGTESLTLPPTLEKELEKFKERHACEKVDEKGKGNEKVDEKVDKDMIQEANVNEKADEKVDKMMDKKLDEKVKDEIKEVGNVSTAANSTDRLDSLTKVVTEVKGSNDNVLAQPAGLEVKVDDAAQQERNRTNLDEQPLSQVDAEKHETNDTKSEEHEHPSAPGADLSQSEVYGRPGDDLPVNEASGGPGADISSKTSEFLVDVSDVMTDEAKSFGQDSHLDQAAPAELVENLSTMTLS